MKERIELIYQPDCPNIDAARSAIRDALTELKIDPIEWSEWDSTSSDAPQYAKNYGSPTVLVDRHDVSGETCDSPDGNSCRVYQADTGFSCAPSKEEIINALDCCSSNCPPKASSGKSNWKSSLAILPGIGVALLPKLACPACWPAYWALLSSLGLGFLLDSLYLLPLTVVLLLVALAALGFQGRKHGNKKPFLLGIVGSVLIIGGKFLINSNALMYLGVAVLVAASIWNILPNRATTQQA